MTMASPSSLIQTLSLALVFATFLLLPISTVSQNPPETSPAPSPQNTADVSPPTPENPSPSPSFSPPAPPRSDPDSDSPSPAPSPDSDGPVNPNSPPPSVPGDVNHDKKSNVNDLVSKDNSSSGNGMSGGQKAGVAFGVIAGACIVGVGAFIYKKRQQNIRRQYGYAARRENL